MVYFLDISLKQRKAGSTGFKRVSLTVSTTREALPKFKLQFDVRVFVNLLQQDERWLPIVLVSNHWFVLKKRLVEVYGKDCNGVSIARYLKDRGL